MSEPIKRVLSDKVTMIYGFEDGHVEVLVRFSLLPMPVTMKLDEGEVPQASTRSARRSPGTRRGRKKCLTRWDISARTCRRR